MTRVTQGVVENLVFRAGCEAAGAASLVPKSQTPIMKNRYAIPWVGCALAMLIIATPDAQGQSTVRTKVRKAPEVNSTHAVPFSVPSKKDLLRSMDLMSHQGPRGTGPVNDDCAGAIALTPGTPCSPVTVDATGSTQSIPGITCNGFTGTADDDVWFSFVATGTSHTIEVTGGTDYDAVAELLEGSCGSLVSIDCADIVFENETEVIAATGLTIGSTYYIRAYDWYAGLPLDPTVSVCVLGAGPPPPANDDCSGISFDPLAVGGSLTFTGDNSGATAAGDYAPGSLLDGSGPSVWHGFTTTTCADITVDYCGTTPVFDNYWIILATSCPADDNLVFSAANNDCGDGNGLITYLNVPAGTYYLPVLFDPGNNAAGPYTIEVAATACATAPANDDCAGAVVLTPAATCVATLGTTLGATESLPAITCNGFTSSVANDVWYSFTATATDHDVQVTGLGTYDAIVELFEGTCGAPVSLDCADATVGGGVETIAATGLTIGTTYWVRVYNWNGGGLDQDFEICILGGGGGGPVNDLCGSVTPDALAVGATVTFTGDNTGATITGDYVPGSTLDGSGFASVWHAITTTECTDLLVEYCGTTPAFGNVWIVLATSCPADNDLVFQTSFNDTDCGDGNFTIEYLGVPAGTYYVPVLTEPGVAEGPYTIDISATACPAPPANDDCANAVVLTPATTCVPTAGTTAGATESLPAITCNNFTSSVANDVWYSFTATSTDHIVEVTGLGTYDAIVELFEGTCVGGLTSLDCADATVGGQVEAIAASGLTIGTTYFVRVYNWNGGGADQDFEICVYDPAGPPANDECVNAVTLNVELAADCPGNAVTGDNSGSTVTTDAPDCDASTAGFQDVWFTFNSLGNTSVDIALDWGTATDLFVEVLDACGGNSVFCDVTNPAPYTVPVMANTDYVVRAFSNNDFGVGGVFTICISGAISSGIDATLANDGWAVFPNPTEGAFRFRSGDLSGPATVEVMDMAGRLVHAQRVVLSEGQDQAVEASTLAPGSYVLRVTHQEGRRELPFQVR